MKWGVIKTMDCVYPSRGNMKIFLGRRLRGDNARGVAAVLLK